MKETKTYENLVEKLKDNITFQAKNYLKEFGSFYPFGVVIEANGELRPTSVYFGEEHPSNEDVLKNLEKALKKGIENNSYKAVAIGVDVLTIPPDKQEKIDAIEIRVDTKDFGNINFYIPYEKLESNEYKLYEAFTNEGTLFLW